MFLVVDLIEFVRDRVEEEGKTSDSSSRHQARTLTARPVTIDEAVAAAPPGPPLGRWPTSASHGGRLPGSQTGSTGQSVSQLCLPLLLLFVFLCS
jgi:hypothetical protein